MIGKDETTTEEKRHAESTQWKVLNYILKETVKITVNRSEPNPPPVENVTIELTPDQASMLRYFFGRLSPVKVRTNVAGGIFNNGAYDPAAIYRMTSSIYEILREEGV